MAITPMKNDAYKYETLHDFDIRYVCVPKYFPIVIHSYPNMLPFLLDHKLNIYSVSSLGVIHVLSNLPQYI